MAKPEIFAEMQSDDCYSAGVLCRTWSGKPNRRVPTRVDLYQMLGRVWDVLSGAREWSSICFVSAVGTWPVASSVASILACHFLRGTFLSTIAMVIFFYQALAVPSCISLYLHPE